MNKKELSERDICTKFIMPAVEKGGWDQTQIREEYTLAVGKVVVRGKVVKRGGAARRHGRNSAIPPFNTRRQPWPR